MPAPGELLFGRYGVLEVRDSGLVRAKDPSGVEVWVFLAPAPPGTAVTPANVLSDSDRYRIGAESIHRSVGSGLENDQLFVVYEAFAEPTLADWIVEGPTRADRVARVIEALGRAVAPLHDQGIAHGHLRPETISVAADGRAHLIGFGFAAVVERVAGARAAAEALPVAYRAPELRGAAPGAATQESDLYALGVIAAELLVGRRAGELERATPRALGAEVSDEVETRLARWVARSVMERPQDLARAAEELAEALVEQSALPRAPVVAPPPEDVAPAPGDVAVPPTPESPPDPSPVAEPPGTAPEPPAAQPPPVPPGLSKSKEPSSIWPILGVVGGVLLMLAGVAGVFAYAMLRSTPPSAPTAVATAVATAPTPVPSFPVVPDAGIEDEDAGPSALEDGGALAFDSPEDGGALTPRFLAADDGSGPMPVTSDLPAWGDKAALVTIVWFGDLECPHTRNSYRVVEAVQRAFGDEVRVVWRHRPLSTHPNARNAARVAAGIRRELGDVAFWRFIAAVSGDARDADRARLEQWVERAGAEPIRVAAWIASRDTESEVSRDLELAGTYDVRATPMFFVNGVRVEGYQSFDDFKAIVQKELAASRALAAAGTAGKGIYAARVRKNMIGLGANVAVRACPALGTSPVRGSTDALVTIVEFSDFECPFCKSAQPTLDTLLARFGGDVRIVWKNYPLPSHPHAAFAAEIALAAKAQGGDAKFWKVHDLLFAEQKSFDESTLESIGTRAGLDGPKLFAEARAHAHRATIQEDVDTGRKLGVHGTPSFFVNGRGIAGAVGLPKFQVIVQEELDTARHLVKSGTARSRVYDAVCGVH